MPFDKLPLGQMTCDNCVNYDTCDTMDALKCGTLGGKKWAECCGSLRERATRHIAKLEKIIRQAYNADCERGDDGGVIEGEAAHILSSTLTMDSRSTRKCGFRCPTRKKILPAKSKR
jgi:hypothetical protein